MLPSLPSSELHTKLHKMAVIFKVNRIVNYQNLYDENGWRGM
jgi:hypothetical protein